MSLTKVSYSMIEGAIYNVLDYGASTSASASANSTAFQATINAAKVTGGTVFIPAGSYTYDVGMLVDKGNVQLVGEGLNATILTYTGLGAGVIIGDSGGDYYGTSGWFKLVGTNAASIGIRVLGVTAGVLDSVWVKGFVRAFAPSGGLPGSGGAAGVWLNARNLTGNLVLSYTVQNCIIEENFTNIDFTGDVTGATNDIHIVRNKIRDAKGGYNIYANIAATTWTIEENDLEANAVNNPSVLIAGATVVSFNKNYVEQVRAGPALVFNSSTDANVNVKSITVNNNNFVTSVAGAFQHCIEWYGNNNAGMTVSNNYFNGWVYALKLAGTYAAMIVEGNNYLATDISDFGGTYFNCRFEEGTTDVTFKTTVRGGMWLAQGGFGTKFETTANTTYQVPVGACRIIFTGAGASVFTLFAATSGRELLITNQTAFAITSATSNIVPLAGGAATTAILAGSAGQWAWLVANGSTWQIMAAN